MLERRLSPWKFQVLKWPLFGRPPGHSGSPDSSGQWPLCYGKVEEESSGILGCQTAEKQPEGPNPLFCWPSWSRQNECGEIGGQDSGSRVPQDRTWGRVWPVWHPRTQVNTALRLTSGSASWFSWHWCSGLTSVSLNFVYSYLNRTVTSFVIGL